MQQPQNDATEGVEIKEVLHDGWTISVRARAAEGNDGLLGSADISRDGVWRCKLMGSTVFDTRLHLIAVMVAKADKWVALQASFAARAY